MSRALDRTCCAEEDARRYITEGGARHSYNASTGQGFSCCRPEGHAGSVHVCTGGWGTITLAKWTTDGEVLP
jgi:hypothetical protein